MENIILLTKDLCPKCTQLKNTLDRLAPTKGVLDKITVVHMSENPEKFSEIVTKYGIRSAPTLIKDGEIVPENLVLSTMVQVNKLYKQAV